MIDSNQFPYIVELMQKYLFQLAAPTLTEAVALYLDNGDESVQSVTQEIDSLLSGKFTPTELNEFVLKHSDYSIESNGAKTLDFIRRVLRHEPHENI